MSDRLCNKEGKLKMLSFEFIRGWFEKAAKEAKRMGRKDSAALWSDGLAQLDSMHSQLAAQAEEIKALKGLVKEMGFGILSTLGKFVKKTPSMERLETIINHPQVRKLMEGE